MTLTYRTAGAWGAGKGANLTPAEVDGNFWQLVADIAAAAAAAGTPNGIANVTVNGSQMTVVLDDATVLGPFTIPRAPFRPTVTATVSTTTHDPDADSANGYFRCTHASGCVVTIPADTEEDDIPVDSEISYRQVGSGAVSFEEPSGVILNGITGYLNTTAVEGAVVTIKKVAANEWDIFGLLAEDVT